MSSRLDQHTWEETYPEELELVRQQSPQSRAYHTYHEQKSIRSIRRMAEMKEYRRSVDTRTLDTRNRTIAVLLTILVAALLAIVIALSPLAMAALDNGHTDWDRLSTIGESYGAISAILSAIAVGAVALALILQARQVKDGRRFAVRQIQIELLTAAMKNTRYLAAWGPVSRPEGVHPDVIVYCNLVLNYLLLTRDTGVGNLAEFRTIIRTFLQGEVGFAYWTTNRGGWQLARRDDPAIQLIEEEFRLVEAAREAETERKQI